MSARDIRTVLKVLKLIKEHMKKVFEDAPSDDAIGMCYVLIVLEDDLNLVTLDDAHVTDEYIRANIPVNFPWGNNRVRGVFGWIPRSIEPRLKWLDYHIKKLTNEQGISERRSSTFC